MYFQFFFDNDTYMKTKMNFKIKDRTTKRILRTHAKQIEWVTVSRFKFQHSKK